MILIGCSGVSWNCSSAFTMNCKTKFASAYQRKKPPFARTLQLRYDSRPFSILVDLLFRPRRLPEIKPQWHSHCELQVRYIAGKSNSKAKINNSSRHIYIGSAEPQRSSHQIRTRNAQTIYGGSPSEGLVPAKGQGSFWVDGKRAPNSKPEVSPGSKWASICWPALLGSESSFLPEHCRRSSGFQRGPWDRWISRQ